MMLLAEDLKKAVLQTAIQGKLTSQLATDSSVDELITKIRSEKELLVQKKNARNDKDFGDIQEEELLFDIPESWRWLRICEIGVYKKGPFGSSITKSMFVPKSANSVKVYEQQNAIQKDASLGDYYIPKEYYEQKMSGFRVEPGDIIVSCAGTIGETYVMPSNIELGIINQALMRMNIVASINLDYFLYYFDHILKSNAKKTSNGSAIKNIPPFDVFKKMLIPIPPIEEQKRIVDRLNIILPEIDAYGEAEKEWESLQKAFPNDISKSILQHAMQGKLVEQRLEEGTGEDLYKEIIEEKNRLISKGIIKSEKSLADITDEEIPFDIPDSWKWVRLGDVSSYTQSKEVIKSQDIKGDMWSLDLEDIQKETGTITCRKLASERKISGDKVRFYKGQILYSKLRPYLKKILIAPEDGICSPELIPFVTYGFNEEYLVYVLKSPHVDHVVNSVTYGVKMPRVGTDTMRNLLIPLPPIEEQNRIVMKIKKLLPAIENLSEVI